MKNWLVILKRRKLEAITAGLLVLALGTSAAFLLPATFRSTATILVEQQETPQELQGAGQSAYADRRLKILTKRVLSSDHLNNIADEFSLFKPELYTDGRLQAVALETLRKTIDIDMVNAEVIDSKMRFRVQTAIAFNVSYEAKTPEVAQKVAERIVQIFLEENRSAHSKSTTSAAELLSAEEEQVALTIKDIEDRLSQFKTKNVYTLPDMKNINVTGLETTNSSITDARIKLQTARENRIYLESELIRLSPTAVTYDSEGGRILGNTDRLKVLRAEYAEKQSRYSSSHPDLARLRREIAGLETDSSPDSAARQMRAELTALKSERDSLSGRYSTSHPSVKSLNRRITSLSKELQSERSRARLPSKRREADNPAYIATASKLKSAELEISAASELLDKLFTEKILYETRLEQAPAIEQHFLQLEREHKQTLEEYEKLRKKRFSAQLAGSLEQNTNEQGLKLLEAANFPEKPHKPNRKLLLAVTLLLSAWSAAGAALLREHFDDRIWTADDIAKELSDPPLTIIPVHKGYRTPGPASDQYSKPPEEACA